jgi:hypothetical protein
MKCGVFVLVAASLDANAACHTQRFNPKLGTAQTTTQVTDGSPCTIRLLSSVDPIYGAEILSTPKNGTVSISGRTSVIYRPRSGFKGIDNYAFQWIGKIGATPTPLTVNVTATIK